MAPAFLPLAIFGSIGPMEWLVIGVVCVLLFGRRLPEIARSLGRSFVEFKRGLNETQNELHNAGQPPPAPPAACAPAAPPPDADAPRS